MYLLTSASESSETKAHVFVHTMEKLSAPGDKITLSAIGGSFDKPAEDSIQTAIAIILSSD